LEVPVSLFRRFVSAAVLVAAIAPAASAQFTVYTDRTAFLTAVGGAATTETFDAGAITVPGLTVDGGSFASGRFNDRLEPGVVTRLFSFAAPGGVTAFGANFDLTPGGAGIGIAFVSTLLGGGTLAVGTEVPRLYSGQFFGFTSAAAFTSIELVGGTQAFGVETYNLDDLTFAAAPTSTVPEPGTVVLLATGLVTLAGAGLRRRAQQ
jgi:hypothetical protein